METQSVIDKPPTPPTVATGADDGERLDALRELLAVILGPQTSIVRCLP